MDKVQNCGWGRVAWAFALAGFVLLAFWLTGFRPVVYGVRVSVPLETEHSFIGSVYYKLGNDTTFRHEDVRVAEGSSVVAWLIPAGPVRTVRIDFGCAPGRVVAGKVSAEGDRRLDLDWKDFTRKNELSACSIGDNGKMTFVSRGSDPYACYGGALDLSPALHLQLCALVSYVAVILLLLGVVLGPMIGRSRLWKAFSQDLAIVLQKVVQMIGNELRFCFSGSIPCGRLAAFMAVVVLLTWGFEVFGLTFTSDDDMMLLSGFPPTVSLSEGRWGAYVFDNLFPNVSVPVLPLSLTLVFYSLSFTLAFGVSCRSLYFLFPLYISFPILYQAFSFSSLNPRIGIALALSAAASRMALSGSWLLRIPSNFLHQRSGLTLNPVSGDTVELESLKVYADRTFGVLRKSRK